MGDETTATTTDAPAEAEAKRKRTTWPIRICRVTETGLLHPLPGVPTFAEAREAEAWLRDNAKVGDTYAQARIGPGVKYSLKAEEVIL